nr:DUF2975 domain-containing protein [uncultured Sphaerochaeta sp.]
MTHFKNPILKPILVLLTISIILGSIALVVLSAYLIIAPLTSSASQVPLPVLMQNGLQLAFPVHAERAGIYTIYSSVVVITLFLSLLFLFFLRKAVASLSKKNGFTELLPRSLRSMGLLLLAATYLRQFHLYLFLQLSGPATHELLEFSFTPINSEVLYALALLALGRVFAYALFLQSEYEQTV